MYVLYNAAMLFTCTQVRSCQLAMKGLSGKLDPLEQTARYWVVQSKQRMYLGERTNRRLSLSLDRGMKDVFASCSEKMAVQVCIEI